MAAVGDGELSGLLVSGLFGLAAVILRLNFYFFNSSSMCSM
jgi:hypothetical protein